MQTIFFKSEQKTCMGLFFGKSEFFTIVYAILKKMNTIHYNKTFNHILQFEHFCYISYDRIIQKIFVVFPFVDGFLWQSEKILRGNV